jgi:hypothetical protein
MRSFLRLLLNPAPTPATQDEPDRSPHPFFARCEQARGRVAELVAGDAVPNSSDCES